MSSIYNNYQSLNRKTIELSSRDNGIMYEIPSFQNSRFIETNTYQDTISTPNVLQINLPHQNCDNINNRNIIPNAQTILQETLQTDTANLIYSVEEGGLPAKSGMKKSQSDFLEQKLTQMKLKHKDLQQQLSDASKVDSLQNRKKNVQHSQSSQGFFKGGSSISNQQSNIFNFGSLSSQIKQMDVISNILTNIKVKPNNNQQRDIEVVIEKNDLYKILKILIDQLLAAMDKLRAVTSERDILAIQIENIKKELDDMRERIRLLEEELKLNKDALTETKMELERLKALYDILEKKYIDLLKKKQEIKIINKETIKEIVVEKPQLNQIYANKKEVRKIIRPEAETKHTIERKLHILERETVRPEIQVIEKVREIPKIEIVEKKTIEEKPFFIEKLLQHYQQVDRFVEVPKFIPKEVLVDRPVFVDRPVERIVKVPQIVEKEKFVDRPVFIEKPVDRFIERETFVDRPVYIQEPTKIIEKNNYIEKPVYINRGVYEPVSSHFVNSYSSPSTQLNSPSANYQTHFPQSNSIIHQNRFSPFNSIQTYSTDLLSPQYPQYIPQQIS